MWCIFCRSISGPFTTREHILPESLGGGDWAILPEGLFCDFCQNKFVSQIEQQALDDYPFSFLRVFIGIPTKRGKAPWFNSWEGKIRTSLQPGIFCYEPASFFENATMKETKTQIRLLAHPKKPEMICRFLLKMGIETVAWDSLQDVFYPKFDEARQFALTGEKQNNWWYLQHEDMMFASRCFTRGITMNEWAERVKLEVIKFDREQELFHLSLTYLDILVPLTSMITPQIKGLEEPEYRLFWV